MFLSLCLRSIAVCYVPYIVFLLVGRYRLTVYRITKAEWAFSIKLLTSFDGGDI